MGAENKPLVRSQGIPVPQYFNEATGEYEPITGRNGANAFIEKGRVVKDAYNGSADVTRTYLTDMYGFGIVNDGAADLTATVNGFVITVKSGESFDDLFEPFRTITINATDAFRLVVRE